MPMTRQDELEFEGRGQADFWFACVDLEVIKDSELSPIDKAVYAVICAHVNVQTRSCPLRVKTIAEEANCSVRSVQLSLKALVERGVIERRERFEDGSQKASVFRVVGHRAACYTAGAKSAPPPCKPCTTPGAENDTPSLREPNTYENKDSSPTEREATPPEPAKPQTESKPPSEDALPLSEAPAAMRETADLLLSKTGRQGLKEAEIGPLRWLDARHYPAFVQKELVRHVEAFKKRGRDLKELNFIYIAQAMAEYKPTRAPTGNRKTPAKKAPSREDLADLLV